MKLPKRVLSLALSMILIGAIVGGDNNVAAQGQVNNLATYTYTEEFTNTVYQNGSTTDANWDTTAGELTLFAGSKGWYKADKTTLGHNNVEYEAFGQTSENLDDSGWNDQFIALDSKDNPNVVWNVTNTVSSVSKSRVYFSKWDGSKWVKADGSAGVDLVSDTTRDSDQAVLSLTSSDIPMIAYRDFEQYSSVVPIMFKKWDASAGGGAGAWVAADGADTGTFADYVVTYGVERNFRPSVAVDSSGQPAISWDGEYDIASDEYYINYVKYSNADSEWQTVDDSPTWVAGCYAGLGACGVSTAIAYRSNLTFNNNDDPCVTYIKEHLTNNADVYATCWDDGTDQRWEKMDGTAGQHAISTNGWGYNPNIVVDSSNNVHVVYSDRPSGVKSDIRYVQWSSTANSWVHADGVTTGIESVTNDNTLDDRWASIALDSNQYPVIVWNYLDFGVTYRNTRLTRWNGSNWVDQSGNVGYEVVFGTSPPIDHSIDGDTDFPHVVIDSKDRPAVGYFGDPPDNRDNDVTTSNPLDDDPFFTRWIQQTPAPGAGESVSVDTTNASISSATLTVSETLNGGTIQYYMRNNTSEPFVAVTPGVEYTFPTAGSDLQWQAQLTSSTASLPSVQSLSITYQVADNSPIIRVEGANPIDQSVAGSKKIFPDKNAEAIILARSNLMADPFAGAPLSTRYHAPLLLTETDGLNASVATEIDRVIASKSSPIYLLGQTDALSLQVNVDLNNLGYTNLVRLGGANRRATSVEIAKEIMKANTSTPKVELVEDQLLVDSFSISAKAAQLGSDDIVEPIVLTKRADPVLDPYVADFFGQNKGITEIELVGGSQALEANMETTLSSSFTWLTKVSRVAGSTRFDTNIAIAKLYFAGPFKIMVASGERSAIIGALSARATDSDAAGDSFYFATLLGGIMAANEGVPLLTVTLDTVPTVVSDYILDKAASITDATVVGNDQQVSQAVIDIIQGLI